MGEDEITSSDRLRRYGPLALIVVLLVAIGAVVVVAGGDDDDPAPDEAADDDPFADGQVGAPDPIDRMPLTYAEAEGAGTVDDLD